MIKKISKSEYAKKDFLEDHLFLIVIIGAIDDRGVIYSDSYICGEEEELTHHDLWPLIRHNKWRWGADQGIRMSTNTIKKEEQLSSEDFDHIIQHIRKVYKLKICGNGIHEDCCY